jgi:hypothetical protein
VIKLEEEDENKMYLENLVSDTCTGLNYLETVSSNSDKIIINLGVP